MKKPTAPTKDEIHTLYLDFKNIYGGRDEIEFDLTQNRDAWVYSSPLINFHHLSKLIQDNIPKNDLKSVTIETEVKEDYYDTKYITRIRYNHAMTDSEFEEAQAEYEQQMEKWKKTRPPRKKPLTKKEKLQQQLNEIKEELNKLERKKK